MSNSRIQCYPYVFQPHSGTPIAAEWGHLSVPENRQRRESRLITIPFVRFRSTANRPGSPVVFLQGGPGQQVLSDLPACWAHPLWRTSLDIADLIFIEQRGFGRSHPCLSCPGSYDVPLNEPGSAEGYQVAYRRYLMRAMSFWQDQGIDLAGYTVRDMAADIDDLRQALGYDTISLLGGSFGTHHGFALLREYGDVIERAFFMGVEGPNHTVKLPSTVQKHLHTLNQLLKDEPALSDHVPDLLDLMSGVLDRLERHPVTVESRHPETHDRVQVTLGPYDAQLVTAKGMGTTPFLRALPRRYLAMQHGDFSWLAAQVLRERLGVTSNLAYPAIDCASGATVERRRQIAEETSATLLGNAINEPFHALCGLLGDYDLGDPFRSAVRSSVPTVLVGGTLDVRTPISNAEELLPHLSHGQLLTIEGVSHDLSIRGDHLDELRRCRDQFFRGEAVTTQHLKSSFAFDPWKDGPQS